MADMDSLDLSPDAGCVKKRVKEILPHLTRRKGGNTPSTYALTSEEFEAAAAQARKESKYGLSFDEIKLEPEVYRIDMRPPEEILAAGGFFPNPEKPKGSMHDHSMKESLGTGSFVSFSYEQSFSMLEWVISKQSSGPTTLYHKDRFSKSRLNSNDWIKLRRKRWYSDSPQNLPQFAAYQVFEYRVKNVLGVRVHSGGKLEAIEKEVLSRGVETDELEYRMVVVKVPLRYEPKIDSKGRRYYSIKSYDPRRWEDAEYTDWKSVSLQERRQSTPKETEIAHP
jgi:hypothetical protein